MTTTWLVLFLGGLVHALALYGFDTRHKGSLVLLLPLAALPLMTPLKRRLPALFAPKVLRGAGTLALLCGVAFLRSHYRLHWDTELALANLLVAGLGLGSLWVAVGQESAERAGAWLWVAAWMGAGALDPMLPMLGAGVAAAAAAWGLMPSQGRVESRPPMSPFLPLLLLGLALPKPWWDWGLDPRWAMPMVALALAAALASAGPLARFGTRLATRSLLWAVGALAILYNPTWGLLWGSMLGLLTGWLWARLPRPFPLSRMASAWFLGLALSFFLHANTWIPGLRHLIWLGN